MPVKVVKKKVAPKKVVKKTLSRKKQRGLAGGSLLSVFAVLTLLTAAGVYMVGGATPKLDPIQDNPPQMPAYSCCDSGDGEACQPNTATAFTFRGQQYALLKSNIYQDESSSHILPTDERTPSGQRIFLNNSAVKNGSKYSKYAGCEPGKDLIGMKNNPVNPDSPCYGVKDDAMIYVCRDVDGECNKNVNLDKVPMDVYWRVSDGPVPSEIAMYCPKPDYKDTRSGQKIVGLPTNASNKNLQLETFQVEEDLEPNTWLGAWCKPAIYLYPESKTDVNVQVAPKGKFMLTIPEYPDGGWDVTAYPDGKIVYGGKTFPYLYWEASLPDKLINAPKDGYVVTRAELPGLFNNVLPKLGLNQRERQEFNEYWLKALPQSPYYFVGVMPEKDIDNLAPLNISPKPDSVLRVTLFFQTLEQPMSVQAPKLEGFTREGFTVTEWGGFFKADKNHKDFTCLM